MTKRVIIDTDPGVDDCAAILLALASPELQVDALTVSYGNGSMPRCADNARRILAAARRTGYSGVSGSRGAADPASDCRLGVAHPRRRRFGGGSR